MYNFFTNVKLSLSICKVRAKSYKSVNTDVYRVFVTKIKHSNAHLASQILK